MEYVLSSRRVWRRLVGSSCRPNGGRDTTCRRKVPFSTLVCSATTREHRQMLSENAATSLAVTFEVGPRAGDRPSSSCRAASSRQRLPLLEVAPFGPLEVALPLPSGGQDEFLPFLLRHRRRRHRLHRDLHLLVRLLDAHRQCQVQDTVAAHRTSGTSTRRPKRRQSWKASPTGGRSASRTG